MKKSYTRREFLGFSAAAAAAFALTPLLFDACSEDKNTVNFFNWSRYIAKNTLPDFTKATGIAVDYDQFSDENAMFTKLRSGARDYDVVMVSDFLLPSFKALGLIDPIPPMAIPNIKNISPLFRNPPYDPQNAYSLPYLWGTTGIGFNRSKVIPPPDSWRSLWDVKYSGKISMLDNSQDCIATALLMLNAPEATKDQKILNQAKNLLIKQRPLVRQYSSDTYIDSLASEEIFLAMGWSGDVLQAARETPAIDYALPQEGSYMWVDNLCLVHNAPHKKEALELINYLLEGPVAAGIANTVQYASPNAAAVPYLNSEMLNDPRIYPPPSVQKRLKFNTILDGVTFNDWNRIWTEVKAS